MCTTNEDTAAEEERQNRNNKYNRCCQKRPQPCKTRCHCGSRIREDDDDQYHDPQDSSVTWWWLNSWLALLCDGLCLLGFVAALLPGFVRFLWYYSVTATNRYFVRYGNDSCRQSLDVYTVVVEDDEEESNNEDPLLSSETTRRRRRGLFGYERQATSVTDESTSSSHHSNNEDDDETKVNNTTPLLSRQSSAAERGDHNDNNDGAADAASQQPSSHHHPVVLFFPGGAWMIGYKMWAALTARVLSHMGCVVVVCDYRNHPFGTIPDMVDDVHQAIQWTVDHIADYGGDATRITVVGQSAGGHLVTTALLKRAMALRDQQERQQQQRDQSSSVRTATTTDSTSSSEETLSSSSSSSSTTEWQPRDLAGLISVSAPYHFAMMNNTFRRHGLSNRTMDRMFGGQGQYHRDDYDPLLLVQREVLLQQQPDNNDNAATESLAQYLPPRVQVWHGSRDATVPWQCAEAFAQAMEELCGCHTDDNNDEKRPSATTEFEFRLYADWTHTDAILEGPLSGSHEFHKDLFQQVAMVDQKPSLASSSKEEQDTSSSKVLCRCQWDDNHAVLRPMWCPVVLAELGRFFIPF